MSRRGHAVIEFALVFPFFVFLCVATFRLGLLAIHQWGWNRVCVKTARTLAEGPLTTAPELQLQAKHLLTRHEPLRVQVRLQSVPRIPSASPHRAQRQVELLDLVLEKQVTPFTLYAHAREVRVRPRGRM